MAANFGLGRLLRRCAVLLCLLVAGCALKGEETVAPLYPFTPPDHRIDYVDEVRPVLVRRCVVCHSCYNSPCQLKFSSWEGFDRGASKDRVYHASRLQAVEPSRLFVDAHSTEQWRGKGFFAVKPEEGQSGYDQSLVFLLLDHKRQSPSLFRRGQTAERFFPEADDLTCADSADTMRGYLKKHPNRGMPFGFPPLTSEEFDLVVGWLSQGSQGPSAGQQALLRRVDPADQALLERWEAFLNDGEFKHRETARYLYEHLFLAHITFGTGSGDFFELVRSRSGPGQEIDLIATLRPYEKPDSDAFYYRFRKIHATIVHKTHMVFAMDRRQYDRVQELFIAVDWDTDRYLEQRLSGVEMEQGDPESEALREARERANPFLSFARIPVRSRYQWLLDNAHYIIMTFIRGPVCKGQVALNVINDQFWVFFLDPDHDLSVRYPGFLTRNYRNLRMVSEEGSNYNVGKVLVDSLLDRDHFRWVADYYRVRQYFYSIHYPGGLPLEAIWPGARDDDDPLLSVFRHFDSATVLSGPHGRLPKTAWVVDYPLLERIYYALVAGFDVYGNAGHQLATRLYMDFLRIEGESYFLDFLPYEQRRELMHSWYIGVDDDDLPYRPAEIPAAVSYQTADPAREFIEKVVGQRLAVGARTFDHNYLAAGASHPPAPPVIAGRDDCLRALAAASAPGMNFVRYVADHNANLAWIRVTGLADGADLVVSAVVERWHDNVKYVGNEDLHLDPSRNRVDFIDGFVGSYPNYFFEVSAGDLPDFIDIMVNYDGSEGFVKRLEKYGVNRAEERFWETYDWFQQRFLESDPEQAGILDLNRYYNLALFGDRF